MAANIAEAIRDCDEDITAISESAVRSLFTEMVAWIEGMFTAAAAIFADEESADERLIRDWVAQSVLARDTIEGPGVADSTAVSTANVIDAVFRTLHAVQESASAADTNLVVVLYTARWE